MGVFRAGWALVGNIASGIFVCENLLELRRCRGYHESEPRPRANDGQNACRSAGGAQHSLLRIRGTYLLEEIDDALFLA